MKHLTLTDRCLIEQYLCLGYSFREIGIQIDRNVSTISREIKNNRTFIHPQNARCMHFCDCHERGLCAANPNCNRLCKNCRVHNCSDYCKQFEAESCAKLDKAPFVCNFCPSRDVCTKQHAYYHARKADAKSHTLLSNARKSLHLDDHEIEELNTLITPLIRGGQSPHHIFLHHKQELNISRTTLYNYIDKGILNVRNIDLPMKVRYRKRKRKPKESFPYKYREGRTYADFKQFMQMHPDAGVVEMDTVIGKREKGKSLLTMIFVKYEFMLIFLLDSCTQDAVRGVFEHLQKALGLSIYRRLFQVILTDNGREFKDPSFMETTKFGSLCTNVFYCDAMASWQKPHVENNHHLIRRVLPKGTSFDELTQADVTRLMNHINSYSRNSMDGACPFDAAKAFLGPKTIAVLDLRKISADDVRLNPTLLR